MTNRFILNISQDVNRVLLGLKSRITPFHSRISSDSILSRIYLGSLIWLFLILGGFSVRAWGETVTFDSWNDYDHTKTATTDGPFVKSPEDGTTFTMGGDFKRYTKKNDDTDTHFFLEKTTTGWFAETHIGTLSWTQPTGYTIAVEGIVINTFSSGKLYIWPNDDTDKEIRIIDNYTNKAGQTATYVYNSTYTYSNESTGYLFPGGKKMGVNDQFKFKATTAEVKINTITLTYTLTQNTYSVSLNSEGGSDGSSSVTMTYDSNSHEPITNPEKEGYTFDGWWTNETDGNGSGSRVIGVDGNLQANVTGYTGDNGIWKKAANTTLYAKWILNSDKTITLNNQGATTAGTESVTVRYKTNNYSTGSTSITVPVKTGYTFDGYYSAASGGVQVIDENGSINADVTDYTDSDKKWINGDEETTLYAHWTAINYLVRFNGNGSTDGSMSNQAFVYDEAQYLTDNAFEKTRTVTFNANGGSCDTETLETEYEFYGWARSIGGDVEFTDGEEIVENLTTTSGDIIDLYAKWSTSPNAVILPTPTKADSIFAGWYNAGNDRVGAAGDSYTPSGDETLKARWKAGVLLTIDDLKESGDLVDTTEHAIFILHSDGYAITDYKSGYGFYVWKPLPISTTKNVTLSWKKTIEDGDYTIKVTSITFKAKAYNSNAGVVYKGKISFNGGDAFSIGTASLEKDGGWSSTIGGVGNYESGVEIQLINTSNVSWETFDYHFKDFQIEYTVTPKAPNHRNANLDATLDAENQKDKKKLDIRVNSSPSSVFTMSKPAGDFKYSYRLMETYEHAFIDEDTCFYATAGGDYKIQARVEAGNDHTESAWSTCTVHVTRTCVFTNGDGDKEWENTGNWAYNAEPTADDAVLVLDSLTVDKEIEMLSLSIEEGAVVEIAPNGGLSIGAGGITQLPESKLVLKAQTIDDGAKGIEKGQTGYLLIAPEYDGDMPEVEVELYISAYKGGGAYNWQYVGTPMTTGTYANTVFKYVRSWNEEESSWINTYRTLEMEPFVGFAVTQARKPGGDVVSFSGTLVPQETQNVTLTHEGDGWNLVANSFAAPIDVTRLTEEDFGGADATIHIWDTRAQNYIDLPINSLEGLGPEVQRVIPAMQAFFVQTSKAATMTLNYNELVWKGTMSNVPAKVQKRTQASELLGRMRIRLLDGEDKDDLYLLEKEEYSSSYENGYDAPKKFAEGRSAIYAVEDERDLAVDATNSIIGTSVGVRTGEETAYTLEFANLIGEENWALVDMEADEVINISEGMQYTFFAEPNAEINDRFLIVEGDNIPAITTGVDNVENGAKVHKFIKDNQLFILKDGVLYNAFGAVVR